LPRRLDLVGASADARREGARDVERRRGSRESVGDHGAAGPPFDERIAAILPRATGRRQGSRTAGSGAMLIPSARRRVMPTHQSLGGATDEELLQRMVATHAHRYDPGFWAYFTEHVKGLSSRPVAVDLGCGPGLFLRDLGERYPSAILHGYDVTPAMIAY